MRRWLDMLCAVSEVARQALFNQYSDSLDAASPEGLGQKLIRDPGLFCPVFATQGLSGAGDQYRAPLVSKLRISQNPFTVSSLVTNAVVDPLKRVVRAWRGSHVRKKRVKRICPGITDKNAPRTVIFEMGAFWIPAPLLHAAPSLVQRVVSCGRFLLSSPAISRCSIAPKASARLNCASAQVGRWCGLDSSAIANTHIGGSPFVALGITRHKKTAKSEANEVNFFRHFGFFKC